MSDYYRSLDSQVFNRPGASSTWINLGLWTPTTLAAKDYACACRDLAMAVGKAARLSRASKRVLDCGFGFGDSLFLWRDVFKVNSVVGVNVTESECVGAVEKMSFEDRKSIRVLCVDAVEFVADTVQNEDGMIHVDNVLLVDSAYHFETRLRFLKKIVSDGNVRLVKGGRVAAVDMLSTCDFGGSYDRPEAISWRNILLNPMSFLHIKMVSLMAGIPLANLAYSERKFARWVQSNGYSEYTREDITSKVLIPFAEYARSEAFSRKRGFRDSLSLWASSIFIGYVGRRGVIRVYLYSMAK